MNIKLIIKKILMKFRFYIFVLKYNNHIDGKINLKGKCYFKFGKDSKIKIKNLLILGENSIKYNSRPSMIRLDKNSKFNCGKETKIFYGADIVLFKNAELVIGNSFINSDCKIRCHKLIKIGDGCAISHDFTIMDSDAHYLQGDNHTNPIIIEDNVWIGTRVTILNGVKIGEGSVIAANSLVTKDVPPRTLVAGCPAKIIKENITWKI